MTQKTILITGASSGIGKEFARLYAQEGHKLILVGRDKRSLARVAQEIKAKATVIEADLSMPGAAKKVYAEAKQGKVDILINNAGSGFFGDVAGNDSKTAEAMIQLNITSLTDLCIFFAKEFKKRKSGAILNVASVVALQPTPYMAIYAASKAYVLNLSEALYIELKPYNVQVTCLCPGSTKTSFFHAAGRPEVAKEPGVMSAADVARIGKDALQQHKMTVVAGRWNALRSWCVRLISRRTAARIAGKYMEEFKE